MANGEAAQRAKPEEPSSSTGDRPAVASDGEEEEGLKGGRATNTEGHGSEKVLEVSVFETMEVGEQDDRQLLQRQASTQRTHRDLSVDLHRGFVMSLMIWNHVTIIWCVVNKNFTFAPEEGWYSLHPEMEPAESITDPFLALYFVQRKMLGSVVSPGFCFLMGEGLQLFIDARIKRGWSSMQILKFLWVRGLLLAIPLNILSDFSGLASYLGGMSPPGWEGDILYGNGLGMLVASLVLVPLRSCTWTRNLNLDVFISMALAVVFQVTQQLLTVAAVTTQHAPPSFLEATWYLPSQDKTRGWVLYYSVMPCLSLVFFGAAYGRVHSGWARMSRGHPRQWLRRLALPSSLALLLLVLFVLVRASDGLGSTHRIADQVARGRVYWQAFLCMTKYPYSIAISLYAMAFNQLLFVLAVALDLSLSKGISKSYILLRPALCLADATLMGYLVHSWLLWIPGVGFLLLGAAFAGPAPAWLSLLVLHTLICPLVLAASALACSRWGRFKRAKEADSLWRML